MLEVSWVLSQLSSVADRAAQLRAASDMLDSRFCALPKEGKAKNPGLPQAIYEMQDSINDMMLSTSP